MSDEIVREFLVESAENLDLLDRELVRLEKDPRNRDTLASVFRTIHTIKGTCGFLGFTKLESVAHVGENLLSKLRDCCKALRKANPRPLAPTPRLPTPRKPRKYLLSQKCRMKLRPHQSPTHSRKPRSRRNSKRMSTTPAWSPAIRVHRQPRKRSNRIAARPGRVPSASTSYCSTN
jgi:HPt (histidine-containing phosphotransfer) domain-containing protein